MTQAEDKGRRLWIAQHERADDGIARFQAAHHQVHGEHREHEHELRLDHDEQFQAEAQQHARTDGSQEIQGALYVPVSLRIAVQSSPAQMLLILPSLRR